MGNPDSDRTAAEARERLPLKTLLQQYGHGPSRSGESWKAFTCPFCQAPKKAGVVEKGGRQWFKCWKADCPTVNVPGKDEVGTLSLLLNCHRRDAWEAWLKQAGLWKENLAPSIMPGQKARRQPIPDPPTPADPEAPARPPEPTPADITQSLADITQSPAETAQTQAETAQTPPEITQSPAEITQSQVASEPAPEPDQAPEPTPSQPAPPTETASTPSTTQVGDGDGLGSSTHQPEADEQGPPLEDGPDPSQAPGKNPLRVFWERTGLEPAHAAELKSRRGLPQARLDAMGPRSAVRGNRAVLEALGQEFDEATLTQCGLWATSKKSEGAKPNPLYYGLGNTGKKDAQGRIIRDWTHPVLIPYWHWRGTGELVYLRPHKDAPYGLSGHLYVPAKQAAQASTAVITEGEWKAEALAAMLPGGYAAAAVPGISMVREDSPGSYEILTELWAWLKHLGVRKVIVAFDREDKSLRIQDKQRRYDTEIWARYLAALAKARGYRGLVAHLPEAWMEGGKQVDGKWVGGKADWDSALARLRREGKTDAQITAAFVDVLRGAIDPQNHNQPGLFDDEAEQIIAKGVARKFYRPKLAQGGPREERVARKLLQCLAVLKGSHTVAPTNGKAEEEDVRAGIVTQLAKAYREVRGRYYVLKPCVGDKGAAWWHGKLASARQSGNTHAQYIAERVLEGIPAPKSDFVMEALHLVNRTDGNVHRRMRLTNVHGEERIVDIGPEIHSPVKFREACITRGPFSWDGNENDLAALRNDTNTFLVGRTVNEVCAYGWHAKARMWVFRDGAITDTGQQLLRDEDGTIWRDGQGYQMSETDQEGEDFRVGHPKYHPHVGLHISPDGRYSLSEGPDDPAALNELAYQTVLACHNSVGGWDAMLAIGMTVAFAVSPEFFRRNQWFPGLWITGQKGSGKSTISRILMRMFGFDCDAGVCLKTSTKVGLLVTMQQYSCLPVWLDDFRHDLDKAIVDGIRSFYDRQSGSKKEFGKNRRLVQTNAIVVGEHTSSDDAAIKQRFVHVHMSEERRKTNHMDWFEEAMPYFFTLGRHILLHRTAFAEHFWKAYQDWVDRHDKSPLQIRTMTVHGVAYAGAVAFLRLFEQERQWEDYVYEETNATASFGDQTVRAEANINVFFHEMVTGFTRGIFSEDDGGVRRYFKVKPVGEDPPGWIQYDLMFDAAAVHGILREQLRRQGRTIPIEISDLRQQMSAQPYWCKVDRVRLRNGSPGATYVWRIAVDTHPMGRQPADQATLDQAHKSALAEAQAKAARRMQEQPHLLVGPAETERMARECLVDPRKGDLYLIVDAVLAAEREEDQTRSNP